MVVASSPVAESTFSVSGKSPSELKICLMKSIEALPNSHFLKLSFKPFFRILSKHFLKLLKMFILLFYMSNNSITYVMSNNCLSNYLEIFKSIFGTKN